MKNSRKNTAHTLRCEENARVVQQYRRLKPNVGFRETTHTFDRTPHIKDNSSVAGDWLIDRVPCEVFFLRGGGVSALSPRYP